MEKKKKVTHYIEKVPVEKIIPLRHEILRPGLPLEAASFDGDDEGSTYHFAAFAEGYGSEPVCCVSYMNVAHQGRDAYQLRGMATKVVLQGCGLGKAVTEYAERIIEQETGIKQLWCNARKSAVPFYEKQNWLIASDEFEIEGVGRHFVMTKNF